ncbi:hypothetical protein ABVT39_022117 [Epinephelus coioides]
MASILRPCQLLHSICPTNSLQVWIDPLLHLRGPRIVVAIGAAARTCSPPVLTIHRHALMARPPPRNSIFHITIQTGHQRPDGGQSQRVPKGKGIPFNCGHKPGSNSTPQINAMPT